MLFGNDKAPKYASGRVIHLLSLCETISRKLHNSEPLTLDERIFVMHALSFTAGYTARDIEPESKVEIDFEKTPVPKRQPHHTPPPRSSNTQPLPKHPTPKPGGK